MQTPWIPALIAFALLAACVVALVMMLLSRQSQRLRRDREKLLRAIQRESDMQLDSVERLSRAVSSSLRQVGELSGALNSRMDELTRHSDERLSEMRALVDEKLDKRLGESFSAVNSQLSDVNRGLGEMRALAASVTDLRKVLGNVKTRGVWGELLLRNVLMEMFAPGQYVENAAIPEGSATHVEFALKLPDREREVTLLPIDSKFPQEDYIRMMDAEAAGDAALRDKCARQLERAVLEQAKLISEKYIRPPQTTDFAVMFLPAEGLYAEVARMPGLIDRVQSKYRVLLSGPSTLCALLTSLQLGFRSVELEKRSGEVLKLLDELRGEFSQYQEAIARTRSRLSQAESELDAMESRARRISKKLM